MILALGWFRGFRSLERIEYGTVTLNLAIIAGLIAGLALYFAHRASAGALQGLPPTLSGWRAVTVAFGLVVSCRASRRRAILATNTR